DRRRDRLPVASRALPSIRIRPGPVMVHGPEPARIAGACAPPGRFRAAVPRQLAISSGEGQVQTRLRSPATLSMRETGGQYLASAAATPAGNAASRRV